MRFTPGPNVKKLFMVIIYKYSLEAGVFVPGRPFKPSFMFVGKARSIPKRVLHSGRLGLFSKKLDKSLKTFQVQTL
jgi:hypothetical protein